MKNKKEKKDSGNKYKYGTIILMIVLLILVESMRLYITTGKL